MNNLRRRALALGLAGGFGFAAAASTAAPSAPADPLLASFDSPPLDAVQQLTEAELEATKGQWFPAVVFGVITVDLALSAYFWGVYVPNYTSSSSGCLSCDAGSTNPH